MKNRDQAIEQFKRKIASDLAQNRAVVAAVIEEMKLPGRSLSRAVGWGNGVSEDIAVSYLADLVETIERFDRGELKDLKPQTFEAVLDYFFETYTEKAMRVEHSSNPFSCAVSLAEQKVAKNLRDDIKWARMGIAHAAKVDADLAREDAVGIERVTIEGTNRVLRDDASPAEAKSRARALLAEMRKRLREKSLSETAHQNAQFWVFRASMQAKPSHVHVCGMVGKDELKLDKAAS